MSFRHLGLYQKLIQTIKSPPDGSRFDQLSKEYKTLDDQAEGVEEEYKIFLGTAEKHSQRKRQANPGVYDGNPKETREWYQEAAQYAHDGAQTYKQAREAREEMAERFIGYDSYTDYIGHQKRTALLKTGENYMKKKLCTQNHTM
ncbi:MAG: hypothetical protein M1840_004343 [Geoglossum simile]|nr:MAG: hypothetical protein M1840_004343 [Geoglossum simile]